MSAPFSPTHYQILGVQPAATQDQIRRAYRALAKAHHPDISQAAGAEKRFARLAAAYEVLSSPEKRRVYDRLLLARRAAAAPHSTPSNARRPHYTWSNIAAPPPPSDTPDISEIDDLYDTFFAGPKARKPAPTRRKPKPAQKRSG